MWSTKHNIRYIVSCLPFLLNRLLKRPIDDTALEEIKAKIDREKVKKARLEQGSGKKAQSSSASTTSVGEASVQRTVSVEAKVQPGDTTKAEVKTENATISVNINLNIQNDSKSLDSNQSLSDVTGTESDAKGEEPVTKVGKVEETHDVGEPMEVEHVDTHMETEDIVTSSTENTQPDRGNLCSERSVILDEI